MGGELDLVASFPGKPPVRLRELGGVTPKAMVRKRRSAYGQG
jgi:hypothetical protein